MAGACVFAAIIVQVGAEFLGSIVHRRRERRDGIGGTQDIAMYSVGLSILLLFAALVIALTAWVGDH